MAKKKTRNQLILDGFLDRGSHAEEIVGFTQKNAHNAVGGFNETIRRYGYEGVKCLQSKGKPYLVRTDDDNGIRLKPAAAVYLGNSNKKNRNRKMVEDFLASDSNVSEIVNSPHISVGSAVYCINRTIRRYKYNGVKCRNINGTPCLVRISSDGGDRR